YLAEGNIKELNIYKASPFKLEALKLFDSSSFTQHIEFENDKKFRINGSPTLFTFGQVFKNEFGVFRITRNPYGTIGSEYKLIWQPTNTVAGNYASALSIQPKSNKGIIVIRLEATNPQLIADIINQLMEEYQHAVINDKNAA